MTRKFGGVKRQEQQEARRIFGGLSVRKVDQRVLPELLTTIARDDDATLARAQAEARLRIELGEKIATVWKSRLKLPSGIVGWRYFCMGEWGTTFFDNATVPAELLETHRAEEPLDAKTEKQDRAKDHT